MNLDAFNAADWDSAATALRRCCSCERWVRALLEGRPYAHPAELHAAADRVWVTLSDDDYLEAFSGHPQIGDMASLRRKYADTQTLAASEQAGVAGADTDVLEQLAQGNADYLARFGFIFIVCATGRSANGMLALLRERLGNSRDEEIVNAAEEQRRIFHLRLDQLT